MFDLSKRQYLSLLASKYPSIDSVTTAIIKKEASLTMPKYTEHFISDIHGEYEPFTHVVRNGSGVIRNYIEELFGDTLSEDECQELATLVYYPEEYLDLVQHEKKCSPMWYEKKLKQLVQITRRVGSKYHHEEMEKMFPKELRSVLNDLLFENPSHLHKGDYYHTLIQQIVDLEMAPQYIIALADLSQRFAVGKLHILGDIYDRGHQAKEVMDFLVNYHDVDYAWGNHDILWMGAHYGSPALICNVLRIALKYNNNSTLEDGYGINLLPLLTFALDTYGDDNAEIFLPLGHEHMHPKKASMTAKMIKAISIIQFKLEGQIISRRPEYDMDHRKLLDLIDYDKGTIHLEGQDWELLDKSFPTVDPNQPFTLVKGERQVIEKLIYSFMHSTNLREHVKHLLRHGALYQIENDLLMFHGGIPLNEDGSLTETTFLGKPLKGKALLDELAVQVKELFWTSLDRHNIEDNPDLDLIWYIWCGPDSPLFGKEHIASFERFYLEEKDMHRENKNPYYRYRTEKDTILMILEDFGVSKSRGRIINGHTPVKLNKGETPVKAEGKLIIIDGAFSRVYQAHSEVAGYTLISNSYGLILAAHSPDFTKDKALHEHQDMISHLEYVESYDSRRLLSDTDKGKQLREEILQLKSLLMAYRQGSIPELE